MIKDQLVFAREFIREFESTGSILPTSGLAAKALTNPLRQPRAPKSIIEVGPGTGSVTVKILRALMPGDHLTICELNPRFMRLLKERFSDDPQYVRFKSNIEFFEGPVQALPETRHYDVIVCAIPFLNLDLPIVQEIFSKLHRLSTPETVMTYYEYIGLRSLGKVISPPAHKQRLKDLDSFFDGMHEKHITDHKRVWWNLLPINVYTLDLAA